MLQPGRGLELREVGLVNLEVLLISLQVRLIELNTRLTLLELKTHRQEGHNDARGTLVISSWRQPTATPGAIVAMGKTDTRTDEIM